MLSGGFENLAIDPLPSPFQTSDDVTFLLVEKSRPVFISSQNVGAAHYDKPMLGSSQSDIDSFVVWDELAWFSSDHWHYDKIKLSTLWAIDRKNLVLHAELSEFDRQQIFLSVVRSYDI